jgi:hypothetical protein
VELADWIVILAGMWKHLALWTLGASAIFAAAPASIEGMVYRESFARASIRTASEKTILLSAENHFMFLKFATVSFVATEFGGRVVLQAPRSDGTYLYRKTGTSTGVLELRPDQGEVETFALIFTSPSAGFGDPSGAAFPDYTFSLAPLAAAEMAPAVNVAMRGRVAAGHPLIAGFVVPGQEAAAGGNRPEQPAATRRDVLIRVVGPSLAALGVTDTWSDPDLQLYSGNQFAVVQQFLHHDWSTLPVPYNTPAARVGLRAGFRRIFDYVGAFPLLDDGKDAAAVVRLAPGAYTIVASPSAGDSGGEVLIEVYFLP